MNLLEYIEHIPLPILAGLIAVGCIATVGFVLRFKRLLFTAVIIVCGVCIFAGCSADENQETTPDTYQLFLPGRIGDQAPDKFAAMAEEVRQLGGDPTGLVFSNAKGFFSEENSPSGPWRTSSLNPVVAAEIERLSAAADECGFDFEIETCSDGDGQKGRDILRGVRDIFGCAVDLRGLGCPGQTEDEWFDMMDRVLCPDRETALEITTFVCLHIGDSGSG